MLYGTTPARQTILSIQAVRCPKTLSFENPRTKPTVRNLLVHFEHMKTALKSGKEAIWQFSDRRESDDREPATSSSSLSSIVKASFEGT